MRTDEGSRSFGTLIQGVDSVIQEGNGRGEAEG